MTNDDLDTLLRSWGRVYGEPKPEEWGSGGAVYHQGGATRHPLDRARDWAPGTRKAVIRQKTTMDRGGHGRRTLMAAGLAGCGVRIVGAGYVDPIPCVETREKIGTPRPDPRFTQAVMAVQSAWLGLKRYDTLRADVLRAEYQIRGMTQRDKAENLGLKVKRYRDELADGRTWMHGRLAA